MDFLSNMFNMDKSQNAHEYVYGGAGGDYEGYRGDRQEPRHQASWTHELVGGAAGFAGKIYFVFDF